MDYRTKKLKLHVSLMIDETDRETVCFYGLLGCWIVGTYGRLMADGGHRLAMGSQNPKY